MSANVETWWRAQKGSVNTTLREYVRKVEQAQGDTFTRFLKLEVLYDPNSVLAEDSGEQLGHVEENAIASNVDTVTAVIAATEILARYQTDGADWGMQRLARHLEWYSEELSKLYDVHAKCRSAFKECAKKGVGLTKVEIVFDEIRVERVLVENVVVDDAEVRGGRTPRQMHEWMYIDADELCLRFPKHEQAILNAAKTRRSWRLSTGTSSLLDNDVEVLQSIRLPVGKKGTKFYQPGRRVLVMEGIDLLDEKYEDDFFPYAVQVWSERITSWYGISGAERIAGIQRALNRRNWQIERQLDQCALPTQYIRPVDYGTLTSKSSRAGTMVAIKGDYPVSVTPVAVSPETYQSRVGLKESAGEEFGQSRMATHATKPAGIDSGVALREYKDQSTQRFALQEKTFEEGVLATIWLLICACKKLGKKAPTVTRHARFGGRKIAWADVDPKEMKVQIAAASTLGRSPAGRKQMVIEFAQAGIISQDEARELLQHPDLERALSLYTAALESIEYTIDQIADGKIVMPTPFMNHEMCVWRGQRELLIWETTVGEDDGAPEEIVEALRQFVVQAAWFVDQKAANSNAAPMAPGMPTGGPMPVDPAAMPPLPGEVPAGTPPMAAFAPQAMQLRAS